MDEYESYFPVKDSIDFKYDRTKELIKKVIDSLPSYFPDVLNFYGALLAGGAIASLHVDKPVNDFDIYVSIYNAADLILYLTTVKGYELVREEDDDSNSIRFGANTSRYNAKFCVRNRVIFRCNLKKDDKIYDIIVSDKDPIDVVNNFDLSCCEVYFDGKNIAGNGLDDLLSKSCHVKPQYIDDHDPILLARQRKYIEKGFSMITAGEPEKPPQNEIMFLPTPVYRRVMVLDRLYKGFE